MLNVGDTLQNNLSKFLKDGAQSLDQFGALMTRRALLRNRTAVACRSADALGNISIARVNRLVVIHFPFGLMFTQSADLQFQPMTSEEHSTQGAN